MSYTWNISIDDTSPLFNYTPYAEGTPDGWATWYSESLFATTVGESAKGDSYHVTNGTGSSVSLEFYGTGFQFLGNSDIPYEVVVDNESPVTDLMSTTHTLYSRDNLTAGTHTATLTSRSTSHTTPLYLYLDKAVILNAENDDYMDITPTKVDNLNGDIITYVGVWTTSNTSASNGIAAKPYHTTVTAGDYLTFNFTGGSAFSVRGSKTPDHERYSVSVDGGELVNMNGSSNWIVPGTVLYYQDGLDDNELHTVKIANVDPQRFTISSIFIFGPNVTTGVHNATSGGTVIGNPDSPSADPHKPKVGVIVGPIVAVLAVILLLIAALIWLRRRRRHKLRQQITPLYPSATQDFVSTGGKGNSSIARPYTQVQNLSDNNRLSPNRYGATREHNLAAPAPSQASVTQTPSFDLDAIITAIAHRIDAPADPNAPLPQYRP